MDLSGWAPSQLDRLCNGDCRTVPPGPPSPVSTAHAKRFPCHASVTKSLANNLAEKANGRSSDSQGKVTGALRIDSKLNLQLVPNASSSPASRSGELHDCRRGAGRLPSRLLRRAPINLISSPHLPRRAIRRCSSSKVTPTCATVTHDPTAAGASFQCLTAQYPSAFEAVGSSARR